jgi:hypothetical protein
MTPPTGTRTAQRAADPPAPLHRHTVVLPLLDTRARCAIPADRRCGPPLADRGRSPNSQAGHRAGRRAGHPLEILAPLDRHLPARLHLPGHRRRRATPARPQPRDSRADPHHRPRTAAAVARHRHPGTPIDQQFFRGRPDSNPSTNARARRLGSTRPNRPAIRPISSSKISGHPGRVYAGLSGHRTIIKSPHNPR